MSNLQFIPTKDNSITLYNPDLNETYHSVHGAITESKHVFIKNGLHHFFQRNTTSGICVIEIGFGTGLNALLTYMYCSDQIKSLQYISFEPFPLSLDVVKKINYPEQLGCDEKTTRQFLNLHNFNQLLNHSELTSIDMRVQIDSFQNSQLSEKVDVIYFDAFAPNKQPEMWDLEVFSKCYSNLNENGFLVTYCAKGEVKRTLKSAGFKVETLPGPPGKREMIRAIKSA